jgi:hypothetical protein
MSITFFLWPHHCLTTASAISVRQEVAEAMNVKTVESRGQALDLTVDCGKKEGVCKELQN